MTDILDEAWNRLHATGPEFDGYLSNHGPMATDALIRLGHAGDVERWLDRYTRRLHDRPGGGRYLAADERAAALGDPRRLADWTATLAVDLAEAPWRDVLRAWWPVLVSAPAAAAAHPLIRTGHAVRALREHETAVRRTELGEALAYWAARWRPLAAPSPAGRLDATTALTAVAGRGAVGGAGARLAALADDPDWSGEVAALRSPQDVAAALEHVVDAAVLGYARWGHGNPVMLVHAATAPRAAALVLPDLPPALHRPTFDAAWACTAAVVAAYRPRHDRPAGSPAPAGTVQDVAELAARHGDEHVVKFTEVALETVARAGPDALLAAHRARRLIEP